MLPPCDPTILQNNSQFQKLYLHVTNELLTPDGSTRAIEVQTGRQAVVDDLKSCQIRHVKREILKEGLRRIAFEAEYGLPDEFHDAVAIVSLYLDSTLDLAALSSREIKGEHDNHDDALSLLQQDIDTFYRSIPTLTAPLSGIFASAINELRQIADPGNPSNTTTTTTTTTSAMTSAESARLRRRSRHISSSSVAAATKINTNTDTKSSTVADVPSTNTTRLLSSQLTDRFRRLRAMQLSDLPTSRKQLAITASEVLSTRAMILERTVILLERTKHGALARATKARAEHLAVVAEATEGKLNVMKLDISAAIYTPETMSALNRYVDHLRDTKRRLEERKQNASRELSAYEAVDSASESSGGGRGQMAEISRRYAALMKQMEDVRMEIQRLER